MGPFTTLVVDAAKWATVSLNKVYSRNLSTIEPSENSSFDKNAERNQKTHAFYETLKACTRQIYYKAVVCLNFFLSTKTSISKTMAMFLLKTGHAIYPIFLVPAVFTACDCSGFFVC